jgi:hypothetical protein
MPSRTSLQSGNNPYKKDHAIAFCHQLDLCKDLEKLVPVQSRLAHFRTLKESDRYTLFLTDQFFASQFPFLQFAKGWNAHEDYVVGLVKQWLPKVSKQPMFSGEDVESDCGPEDEDDGPHGPPSPLEVYNGFV